MRVSHVILWYPQKILCVCRVTEKITDIHHAHPPRSRASLYSRPAVGRRREARSETHAPRALAHASHTARAGSARRSGDHTHTATGRLKRLCRSYSTAVRSHACVLPSARAQRHLKRARAIEYGFRLRQRVHTTRHTHTQRWNARVWRVDPRPVGPTSRWPRRMAGSPEGAQKVHSSRRACTVTGK